MQAILKRSWPLHATVDFLLQFPLIYRSVLIQSSSVRPGFPLVLLPSVLPPKLVLRREPNVFVKLKVETDETKPNDTDISFPHEIFNDASYVVTTEVLKSQLLY